MMLALILAQLVLPWPGLDSPLVQPPGMICLGACAGPVIYGAAERGRLVVACDMQSDTCSDGRQITTVRASPVPCEVSPGVWEMVGVDEGCYSVRGLESWAANTSYLSWGAELDRAPWAPLRSGTIEKLSDGYRITSAAGQSQPSGRIQVLSPQETEGPVTLSCVVRTQSPIGRLTLEAGMGVVRHIQALDTGGQWETVSVSGTVATGASRWVGIAPRNTDLTPASVDVKACWLTHASTPGRPCWGGEAPVTCAADRHTVSTEGWPTTEGEISVTVTVGDTDQTPVIIDGRATSGDVGPMLYVTGATTNSIGWRSDSVTLTAPNVIERHKTHRIVAGRRDGRLYLVVDGVRHEGPEAPPLDWQGEAILGRGRVVVVYQGINGSISSLRIRSTP